MSFENVDKLKEALGRAKDMEKCIDELKHLHQGGYLSPTEDNHFPFTQLMCYVTTENMRKIAGIMHEDLKRAYTRLLEEVATAVTSAIR